jgi:hypothetical protein
MIDSALGNNHLFSVRIRDGEAIDIGTFGGEGFWHVLHVSANSMHLDDLVYLSLYKDVEVPEAGWTMPWINEVVRLPVLGGPIERIAHHRSRPFGRYYYMPRGSVSREGRFYVYASNFNRQAIEQGIPPGYVDAYLIDLDRLESHVK